MKCNVKLIELRELRGFALWWKEETTKWFSDLDPSPNYIKLLSHIICFPLQIYRNVSKVHFQNRIFENVNNAAELKCAVISQVKLC